MLSPWLSLLCSLYISLPSKVEGTPVRVATNASLHSGHARCVNTPEWITPNLDPNDCVSVALQFSQKEVAAHAEDEFEFVPAGATGVSGLPIARTPRRYTYRSCTMAIQHLGVFRPGQIPGYHPIKPPVSTDFGNYRDIWYAVNSIINTCLDPFCNSSCKAPLTFTTQTGWSYAGTYGAIGVFLWGTGSFIDKAVFPSRRSHVQHLEPSAIENTGHTPNLTAQQ